MKLRIAQLLIVIALLTCGFTAGHSWPRERITEDDPRWNCRTMGDGICGEDLQDVRVREIVAYIEDCTLRDAHAARCTIPCGDESDCLAKNGTRDGY